MLHANTTHMDNREVAALFRELAALMDIMGENPFKIRSYEQAYRNIRGMEGNVLHFDNSELSKLPGFGKAIIGKIEEIKKKGTFDTLERYRSQVPKGIVEISRVSGLGAKKVKEIMKMGITSLEELLQAAEDGRLTSIKGISHKSVAKFIPSIQYLIASRGKVLFSEAETISQKVMKRLKTHFPSIRMEVTGPIAAFENVISRIEILIELKLEQFVTVLQEENLKLKVEGDHIIWEEEEIPVILHFSSAERFGNNFFEFTASTEFKLRLKELADVDAPVKNWEDIFRNNNFPVIEPELWHDDHYISTAIDGKLPELIEINDIKGLVHLHTKYSDGTVSLEGMIQAAIQRGFEYIVVTDHSQSAGYAGGLKINRLNDQWKEIEYLREKYTQIDIYKGIESDILKLGTLDYPDEILSAFDIVIGSIHSGLDMDKSTATDRLKRAIEHPQLRILGHMTGRLLLRRKGYPVDHLAIIEACAAHNVVIEINANPRRLDIDWRWVQEAIRQGVKLSIQPDAHSIKGISDIYYGVKAGRKGGLSSTHNLTSLSREDFKDWVSLT